MMTLEEVHAVLQHAFVSVESLRGALPDVPSDTAFAIGEALGHIMKAKALVGRDVDDSRTGKER